ncbi:MAG: hypothetical protein PHN57_04845 [Candidatus Omnitrophica bacterium]|nr:hypothetical protein [Candidatus Omnitrophota bacterium]
MKLRILSLSVILALFPLTLCAAQEGSSMEKAIIIKFIGDYKKSIGQEYEYIKKHFGVIGQDLQINGQSLKMENGKYYDEISISLIKTKEIKTLYFDITEPFAQMVKQTPPPPKEKKEAK